MAVLLQCCVEKKPNIAVSNDEANLSKFLSELSAINSRVKLPRSMDVYMRLGSNGVVTELGLENGTLDSIPSSINKLNSLEKLTIENCQLNSTKGVYLPQLEYLVLKGNNISNLDYIATISDSIKTLDLQRNKLSGVIYLDKFPKAVNDIDLSKNKITKIILKNARPRINFIDLSYNRIFNLDSLLCETRNLSKINLIGNKIKINSIVCDNGSAKF